MLTYEQLTDKLLKKREALEERIREDNAEIEKINAKLNEIQLAKVRDTFGLSQKDFFDLITKHPEKLLELTAQSNSDSFNEVDADDETVGQTSFFDKKSNPYSD